MHIGPQLCTSAWLDLNQLSLCCTADSHHATISHAATVSLNLISWSPCCLAQDAQLQARICTSALRACTSVLQHELSHAASAPARHQQAIMNKMTYTKQNHNARRSLELRLGTKQECKLPASQQCCFPHAYAVTAHTWIAHSTLLSSVLGTCSYAGVQPKKSPKHVGT